MESKNYVLMEKKKKIQVVLNKKIKNSSIKLKNIVGTV